MAEGHLLLVRKRDAYHTFLPGGHVHFGEAASDALIREIEEEMGLRPEVAEYLGSVEHSWEESGERQHELNLIFRMSLEGIAPDEAPVSRESHLQFLWQPLEKLEDVNLQPHPFWELLPGWLKEGARTGWGSSMK